MATDKHRYTLIKNFILLLKKKKSIKGWVVGQSVPIRENMWLIKKLFV